MTGWQLWKALKQPLEAHPIYRRVLDDIYDDHTRWQRKLQRLLTEGQLWLWPLLFMLDMRAIMLVVLGGSLYGIIWATSISSRIYSEQNRRTYELLCLTSEGIFGAVWAIITGSLHRERIFGAINSLEAWGIRILLLVPFIFSSQLLLERVFSVGSQVSLFWIAAIVALYALDHVQSIMLGCLCGAFSAHLTIGIDKRLAALIGFLSVQFGTYVMVLLVCAAGLPALQSIPGMAGRVADIIYPVITVAIFYLTREYAIRKLWWQFNGRLGITTPSYEMLLQLGRRQTAAAHPYDDTQVVARA